MFLGMRGNGDWIDNQRPESFRENILYLYPNGMAPLTAILSMMGSEKIDDPVHHWFTQTQTAVGGTVDGVYTLPDLTAAYAGGGVEDDYIYVVISSDNGNRVRAGHQILLRDASDWRVDINGKVTNVARGTGSAVLTVKLLEDDDNSPDNDLQTCDTFKIIGNINPEGGEMPSAIALNPVEVYNRSQIFRTPLSMTRTAMRTRLRTGNQRAKAKAEALEMHSWEMELAFIWGVMTSKIGDNNQPERTMRGLIPFIRQYAPGNCDDFTLNADYAGETWAAEGETWFKNMLEQIFRYGADEKLCLCGSGFLLGIDALAMAGGQINLQPAQKTYGMQIRSWITPFGTIHMKTHPLFSYDATTRNMGVLLEPKEIGYRYIDDTNFYGESDANKHPSGYGQRRIDGIFEEFLTETTLEFGLPQKCAVLNGVGSDNDLTP